MVLATNIYLYCALASFIVFTIMQIVDDFKEHGGITFEGKMFELKDIIIAPLFILLWVVSWGFVFLFGWWIFWMVYLYSKFD